MIAGASSRKGQATSTKDCLSAGSDARAATPPEIRKYRRSNNLEPGKRYVHHGLVDDIEGLNLDNRIYGVRSQKIDNNAADLMRKPLSTELDRINAIKAERVYKTALKEVLGQTIDRKIILPEKFSKGNEAFGIKSNASEENAKDVLFPQLYEDNTHGDEMYIRTHGSYRPGEQKTRNYDWPIDPNSTRFGKKGNLALNGVSNNIYDVLHESEPAALNKKKVEDIRSRGDILGTTKDLLQGTSTRSKDIVYGCNFQSSSKRGQQTAAELLSGRYMPSEVDAASDRDLGKSITPGFRNIAPEGRVFGCPSIRTDLTKPDPLKRSVASYQNYGDDSTAKELINPHVHAGEPFGPTAFDALRSKESLQALFQRLGYDLNGDDAESVFLQAVELTTRNNNKNNYNSAESLGAPAVASINAYRDALNMVMEKKSYVETR